MNTLTVEAEYQRVKNLNSYELDYEELQEEFQHLNQLAARIAGTDISLINLIDTYTQWTISSYGMAVQQTPREKSICQYTIQEDDYLEIPSVDEDERFSDIKNTKYYLGFPLTTDSGDKIGALCVIDSEKKEIGPEKKAQLKLIAEEIVERLQLKKDLKRAKKEIYQVLAIKNKLAHDVRSPVSSMLALARLASEENPLSLLEAKSYLKKIERSSSALLELTSEILDSRDSRFFQPIKISVKELGDKILSLYKPQGDTKNVILEILRDPSVENAFVLYANLLQIIGNLVSNAIKFTPSGGKVTTHFSWENERFEILVSDSGKGLAAEKIQLILEGGSIISAGTAGEIGYGLGLKIVRSLIDEVNGKLEISSSEENGSSFKVSIPQP